MATLIAYASKYGCTRKAAGLLWGKLDGRTDMVNLVREKKVDLSQYEKVILCGSIYEGRIQRKVKKFTEKHLDELLQKKVGLFICCMKSGEAAQAELEHAFPKDLLEHAVISDFFGGELSLYDMNLIDKFLIKVISKRDDRLTHDTSNLSLEKIQHFAEVMDSV
ncbi:flavodoxin domain-containing protein [Bacillus massilinigeriensis]|uniref:flavodoxin domain-containing protein n=1 Tax=Bacillus mediterraneensis TaxID=1805474 RepID=UPI0008F81CD1|nr:flavodoxin domain-containing protein [Bacillus mediterraneensis]